MEAIQFETVIDGDIIHIPEEYLTGLPLEAIVTLIPVERKPFIKPRKKTTPSSIDEFPALLDTDGWKFNREEANER